MLEKREVLPVGATTPIPVDVRVIAATNLPYKQLSDPNLFRQDLLFRLNTVEIVLPPLRKRPSDLPAIATHFIALYCQKYGKRQKVLSNEALDALTRYAWPGNVRELRHAIERAVILSQSDRLDIADFQFHQANAPDSMAPPLADTADDADLNLDRLEYRAITQALKRNRYIISNASKDLGLTRAALYRRMEKYGI